MAPMMTQIVMTCMRIFAPIWTRLMRKTLGVDWVAIGSELPSPGLEDIESKAEHEGGHAEVIDERTRIDEALREVRHVLDDGEVSDHVADEGRDGGAEPGEERAEKQEEDGAERDDGGDDLVAGEGGGEAADGEEEHAE